MTTQTQRKNGKFIILGLIALVAVGLFVYKIVVENKIKAWATEDLSLYEPLLKLESAKVEASYLGASVSYKDVVYSLPDAPTVKITIDSISQEGIDSDTLMGKPGDVSTVTKASMSGFRVLLEGAEQPIMEIGYYELNDIATPYRDIRQALIANKDNPDLMGIFQAMAPIFEKSTIKSGASSMRDFKINMRQLDFFDMILGESSSSGFRALSQEADGFDAATDESRAKNIQISADMPDGSEIISSLESIELKGLKYNYKEMMAALGQINEQSDPIEIFMAIMPSLYNYKFDSMALNKLTISAFGGVFTLDSINLGPRSLKEQGPNVASGMKASLGAMEVFSLESIGLDKLILSDTIVDFINRPDTYAKNESLLASIAQNPFMALEGMKMENLFIKNLDVSGIVKIASWASNVIMHESVKITNKIDQLHVSPTGLRQASMLVGGGEVADLLGIFAMNPDGLLMDSNLLMDIQIHAKEAAYDVDFDMDAAGQGTLAIKLSGMTDEPVYSFQTYGEPMLQYLDCNITDNGILDNTFNYLTTQGHANSPEEVKAIMLAELDESIPTASANEASILRGLRQFIQNGGKLGLTLNLPHPILIDDIDMLDTTSNLGLSVTNSN